MPAACLMRKHCSSTPHTFRTLSTLETTAVIVTDGLMYARAGGQVSETRLKDLSTDLSTGLEGV